MPFKAQKIHSLKKALRNSKTYTEWYAIAEELDQLEGKDEWQKDPESEFYDYRLILEHIYQMQNCRKKNNVEALADLLLESLYRNQGDISDPALYHEARTGTKHLIQQYLDEVEASMNFMCDVEIPELPPEEKLQQFKQAATNYGETALMLSGGGAFGIYHVGVAKALWEQQLLPKIISGSSMGSIVAAGISARTDDELDYFFEHPETIHREAIKRFSLKDMLTHRLVLDPSKLLEHIYANVGHYTFEEAYRRSGRILNITVSPTRSRQKPRVLNFLTASNVLIAHSALASCAIPGVFPPVSLVAKDRITGHEIPYMATETWMDGSVHSDLPQMRISRLHNVNHTIVSQANPHVLPFITHRRRKGVFPFLKHRMSSLAHALSAEALEAARDLMGNSPLRSLMDKAYSMSMQTYLGDINIQFPFKPHLYPKVVTNPDWKGLQLYIQLGEHATWPQIPLIRDQTRINKVFDSCIQRLEHRISHQTPSTSE